MTQLRRPETDTLREFDGDTDFCSRCHEHADWEWDEESGEWLSGCCWAPPVEVDPT